MEKSNTFSLTRRGFLKGVSALGVATVSSGAVGNLSATAQSTSMKKASEFTYQLCPRNCHDTCTLISETVDGKIIRVTGDPTNPITDGTPCVKGHTYVQYVYSPERVLTPLKHVGKKGENKWQKISWGDAFKICAERLNKIIDEFGGESVVPYSYSGVLSMVHNYGGPSRFFNKLGGSNLERTICSKAGDIGFHATYGQVESLDPETYADTKLFVSWGINHAATNVHIIKFINQAREKGAKLVEINTVRTPLASQADLFLQPRIGTDSALALGIMNYMIENNLYDADFVKSYTLGFEALKEKAAEYPLDKVAEITGVSEYDLKEFAELYGTIKPSIIRCGYGIQRNTNGAEMTRAISLLPALSGTVGTYAGGWVYINTGYWPYDWGALGGSHLAKGKVRTLNMNQIGIDLNGMSESTAKIPIKAFVVYNSNPMTVSPNVNLIKKGLERDDLFTIVLDHLITDTALYADIFLPACTSFEFEDVQCDYLGHYIRHNTPAIKPLGESRSNSDIFYGLLKAMGHNDPEFSDTEADTIRKGLNNKLPYAAHITYERLKREHWIKFKIPTPFADRKFKTKSGKIELYSEELALKGFHPVVSWTPAIESREGDASLFAKYPYALVTPAMPLLLNSQWHNVKYIRERLPEQTLFINRADAEKLSLIDGCLADVFNDRGKVRMKVKISNIVTQGTVCAYKNYWQQLTEHRGTVNMLTSDRLTDLGNNSSFNTNLVMIERVRG